MADQLIYLVETVTAAMADHDPVCLADSGLAAKLGEGFEVISTMPTKKVTIGKKVSVTPMLLRQAGGPKNALSLHEEQSRRPEGFQLSSREERGGGLMATVMDKLSAALTQMGDGASHLGAPRNHNMPGLTIVSGEMVAKAWDLGMAAARRGQSASNCPFPPRSEAATKWLQGHHRGSAPDKKVDAMALCTVELDAYELALSLGADDEVVSPYPSNSEMHAAWMSGFKRGGGRVE